MTHTDELQAALNEALRQRDDAYRERDQCVALLSHMAGALGLKVGMARTNIPGWDPEWHCCVYVDLPTGQVSWHFHDSEMPLFQTLPLYTGEWDGHDTEEKYRRVNSAFRDRSDELTAKLNTARDEALEEAEQELKRVQESYKRLNMRAALQKGIQAIRELKNTPTKGTQNET